jgi:tetratricopeptide (TPR) repeat protein
VTQSDQGRHDEAIARLRQGLKALGDSPEANMLQTQVINQHLLAGRAESVEAICRRKIAADPRESGSYFFLVRLYAGRGDAPAAQRALETYRQKLRASLKSAGRDFDDAQKTDFMLAECEGVTALAAGRPAEALEWLQTAQKRTESWWVRRRLQTEEMAALLQLNRQEEARGLAATLLKVNPNLPELRRLLAGPGGTPGGRPIGRVEPPGAGRDAAAAHDATDR